MEQATPKKRVLTEDQRDRKNKHARDKRKSERAIGILPIKRKRKKQPTRVLTEEQR